MATSSCSPARTATCSIPFGQISLALSVRREELGSPVAQALISALNDELTRLYPEPGATHFRLDAEEVAEGRGAFVVAWLDGKPVGCGAMRRLDPVTAELKRMYVANTARGQGIARTVLETLESEARRLGVRRLVLETGPRQQASLALYEHAGFVEIPPFGEYEASPFSIFMAKDLAALRVRGARPSDRDAIAAVTLSAYQEYAPLMPAHWEGYRQNIVATLAAAEPAAQIVAERDGRMVGSVLLHPAGAVMAGPGGASITLAEPEVRLLAVAPEARGQGVGVTLMRECIRRARESGAAALTLHTTDIMRVAMRLYERMGFGRAPELDFQPAPGVTIKGYRLRLDAPKP